MKDSQEYYVDNRTETILRELGHEFDSPLSLKGALDWVMANATGGINYRSLDFSRSIREPQNYEITVVNTTGEPIFKGEHFCAHEDEAMEIGIREACKYLKRKKSEKDDVGGSPFFSEKIMASLELKQPKVSYHIGVDTSDRTERSYCLSREVDGVFEIILAKSMLKRAGFDQEVENLAKYFDAKIIADPEWIKTEKP